MKIISCEMGFISCEDFFISCEDFFISCEMISISHEMISISHEMIFISHVLWRLFKGSGPKKDEFPARKPLPATASVPARSDKHVTRIYTHDASQN